MFFDFFGILDSAGRRCSPQRVGFNGILGHSFTLKVHYRQQVLCIGMTLFRRFSIPGCRLFRILRNAPPVRIGKAKIKLSLAVPLNRRIPVQVSRPAQVLWNPFSTRIQNAKRVLRLWIASS